MENLNYNHASMLDIVFENRNKAYGAYVLRQDENKRIMLSILLMFASVLTIVGAYKLQSHLKPAKAYVPPLAVIDTLSDVVVELEKIKPIEEPKPKPQKVEPPAPKPTVKDVVIKVVANNKPVEDSIIPNKDLLAMNVDIGKTTNLGPNTNPLGIDGGTGKGPATTTTITDNFVPFVPNPEVMPEFPGGEKALFAFLRDNTEYPERPRILEIEGKVTVKFIVNEDGTVTDAKILKGVTEELDREAMRVVKRLPKFKPGMQGGRNVKVPYVIPFNFKLGH